MSFFFSFACWYILRVPRFLRCIHCTRRLIIAFNLQLHNNNKWRCQVPLSQRSIVVCNTNDSATSTATITTTTTKKKTKKDVQKNEREREKNECKEITRTYYQTHESARCSTLQYTLSQPFTKNGYHGRIKAKAKKKCREKNKTRTVSLVKFYFSSLFSFAHSLKLEYMSVQNAHDSESASATWAWLYITLYIWSLCKRFKNGKPSFCI